MVVLSPHLMRLRVALETFSSAVPKLEAWGHQAGDRLLAGARLLAAGNGGSAAQAQHLTAELVGRYEDERPPFSAIALHTDTSSVTAIANDYGVDEVFARQVRAHGRANDVLVLLSTSGESRNVLTASEMGRTLGLTVWALTGPTPNTLARQAHDTVSITASNTATIQELHLVAVHVLTAAVEQAVVRQQRDRQPTVASASGGDA